MPLHIKAEKGDVAERVLLAGDPDRVRMLSEMLESPRLVNENRGFLTYTGTYRGERITVACHGIGGPSIAIVAEELHSLGARVMVRFGTAGGLISEMNYGDIIIATGAFGPHGSTLSQYSKYLPVPASPSYDVLKALVDEAQARGVKAYLGPVYSDDAFYAEGKDFVESLRRLGYVGVEMEAYTLLGIANMRGFRAGALFMVSNNLVRETELLPASALKQYLDRAAGIAFDALLRIKV
ncbi:MAG: purine-nucleoside phosphorylase [Nitrososphaeria archaeon]